MKNKGSKGPGRRPTVYGRNAVKAALESGRTEVHALLASGKLDPGLQALAKKRGLTIHAERTANLDQLTAGGNHQGIVALTGPYPHWKLHDFQAMLDDLARSAEPALVVVLDQVQDPRNLGAVVRSALELGAHGVIVPRRRSASVTAAAVKASAGATEFLPVVRVGNIAQTLAALDKQDLMLVAATGEGGRAPETVDLTGPLALILGSEGKGLRPLVERACGQKVTIPLTGRIASLNVSVAAGILLAETARQRRAVKRR